MDTWDDARAALAEVEAMRKLGTGDSMGEWILTTERMPEPGQLVVKYWTATGNVWAGKHIAHAKHESFDKWLPLPVPNAIELTGSPLAASPATGGSDVE